MNFIINLFSCRNNLKIFLLGLPSFYTLTLGRIVIFMTLSLPSQKHSIKWHFWLHFRLRSWWNSLYDHVAGDHWVSQVFLSPARATSSKKPVFFSREMISPFSTDILWFTWTFSTIAPTFTYVYPISPSGLRALWELGMYYIFICFFGCLGS